MDENGLEWRRVARKEHLGRTKMLKKLFEQRKMRLRPFCNTGHHLICNSVFRGAKIRSSDLGGIWSSVGFQLFIGKQSIWADHSPIAWEKFKYHDLHQAFDWEHLRNEKEFFSRWTEYVENMLNPVRATPTDTCDTIDFGKEEVFKSTEVAAATRIESGKDAGENEI